jgi:hypothetical protein
MRIKEVMTKPQAPLTPEQSRIQALKAQAKRSQNAVKIERQRQKMQSAQQAISKLSTATSEGHKPLSRSALVESPQLRTFQAQLSFSHGGQSTAATMTIQTQNINQARAIFRRLFGSAAVISVMPWQ